MMEMLITRISSFPPVLPLMEPDSQMTADDVHARELLLQRKEKETIQFEWYPRLLYPKIRDSVWLEVSNHPELFALAPLTMLRLRLRTGSPCFWRAFRTRTRPRTLFWISSFRPRKAASC